MPGFNPDYILANVRVKDDPSLVLVAQLTDVKTEDVAIDMELTSVYRIGDPVGGAYLPDFLSD